MWPWQLEEESTKTRLLLPSLQAANKELQSTVQRLREREAERMAMTIEAEQTATSLRRELAEATAALERSSQARAQLEERLGAVREQLEREQREHRRAAEEHAATVGRLRKERRALRLVSTEHGAQGEEEGEDEEGAQQFETVRSQAEPASARALPSSDPGQSVSGVPKAPRLSSVLRCRGCWCRWSSY